jgi:haloalkane dehalogenase
VTDAVRIAEELLDGLPDFAFRAHYRELDGLRLAHLDEGAGPPVLFCHGEPTWSFLWRKVIPPVLDAGYRCIAPDLPGFGRSDKPVALDWYSYDRRSLIFTARRWSFTIGADRSDYGWRWSIPSGSPSSWCSTRDCSRAISR